MKKEAIAVELGRLPFDEAWELQRQIYDARRAQLIPDTLLFVEHPHTFTLGKTGSMDHLLLNEEQRAKEDIHFSKIDRGGDITYHGPGQMVVYPIIDLNQHYKDLHRYLRDLEEVIISVLSSCGLDSGRVEGLTGVWIDGAKMCAIGVKVSRWITMHGLALNHTTDLSFFQKIVPCGISDKPVCSLEQFANISKNELYTKTRDSFSSIFDLEINRISSEELMEKINL